MSFSITYISSISADSQGNDDNIYTAVSSKSIIADYSSKLTFVLTPNQEQTIALPGVNSLIAINVSGSKPINLSINNDNLGVPIYDNNPSLLISKFFGNNGSVFEHVKVKAGLDRTVVTLTVVGNESLPTI